MLQLDQVQLAIGSLYDMFLFKEGRATQQLNQSQKEQPWDLLSMPGLRYVCVSPFVCRMNAVLHI